MKAKEMESALFDTMMLKRENDIEFSKLNMEAWLHSNETQAFFEFFTIKRMMILSNIANSNQTLEELAFARGQLKMGEIIQNIEDKIKSERKKGTKG